MTPCSASAVAKCICMFETEKMLVSLEKEILSANSQFYKGLQILTNKSKSKLDSDTYNILSKLSSYQISIIERYKKQVKRAPAIYMR